MRFMLGIRCKSCPLIIPNKIFQNPINIDLSEQNIIDCSNTSPYNNKGFNGGFPIRALQYMYSVGQTFQTNYRYKGINQACQMPTQIIRTSGVVDYSGQCVLMQKLMSKFSLTVTVDATNWKTYATGIFNNCDTKINQINHAAFVIGTSDTAWTVKNLCRTTWGEQGYIRLAKGNTCIICQALSSVLF